MRVRPGVSDEEKWTARDDLYALHQRTCAASLEVMKKKNVDYSTADDPFQNFRMFGRLGILVRLSDKLSRLKQFEANGSFAVESESLDDTIQDIINYAVLFKGFK